MDQRTNSLMRFGIFGGGLAGTIIGFLTLMGIGGLVLPVLLGVVIGVGGLILFCWGGTRIIGYLFYGSDPDYQAWVANGDPWFDTLPWPFRGRENQSGNAAPFHCPTCQHDMFVEVGVCPSCGYGADCTVCPCGTTVREPHVGAFETGVMCPTCRQVLMSTR